MFSRNDKISSRQIKRLLIFDLFGASSLLLPAQLAKSGNGSGLWCILAGMVMAGLYLWLLLACCSQASSDYLGYLKESWGGFLSRVFYFCYALAAIFTCAWTAKLLAELMCATLLETKEFAAALFVILLLALYGGTAGLEARARVYEILFWLLVIPFVIMLLLCVRQVQVIQWFPLSVENHGVGWAQFCNGTWQCFAAFLPLTFLLFLIPHVQDGRKAGRAACSAAVISGVSLAVIYLILLGIFGSGALAREAYPAVTLMGMVKIPGDFVKRLDAVMVGVWFFTLYALIGSGLYYGVNALRMSAAKSGGRSSQNRSQKQKRGQKWWFFVITAAVYGIAYGLHIWPQAEEVLRESFYVAGIPFLVLVPVGSLFLHRVRGL